MSYKNLSIRKLLRSPVNTLSLERTGALSNTQVPGPTRMGRVEPAFAL